VSDYRTSQKDARYDFEEWCRREGVDLPNVPRPNNFAQRVLGSDARLDHGQGRDLGRYFIGLRILPALFLHRSGKSSRRIHGPECPARQEWQTTGRVKAQKNPCSNAATVAACFHRILDQ
jgi:hypothetical protein